MARSCRLDVHFAGEETGLSFEKIQMAGQSGSYWGDWLANHAKPPSLEEKAGENFSREYIFSEEKLE